tara:strand:- start:383 stop:2485 length:2103 start_codon:yes stop_codon:yes gene_type:complete
MTVYWADPFLEATTQGNGTTDTTTKNGTYAAPFSVHSELIKTNTAAPNSFNGVTISDGDEIRLKGLSFSDLFASEGNVYNTGYGTGSSDVQIYGDLEPVTGNSTADFASAGSATGVSNIYAFQNSDISSYLPGWSHPLFFAAHSSSTTSTLQQYIQPFVFAVVYTQLGYNAASTTGIEVFRVKDTYANRYSHNQYIYAFNTSADCKISAGWTSETAQDGYSILETMATTNFERLYIGAGSSVTDTYFDLGRLMVHAGTSNTSGFKYTRLYVDFNPSTNGGTGILTAPMILAAEYYAPDVSNSKPPNVQTNFPLISGGGYQLSSTMSFNGTADTNPHVFENMVGASPLFASSHYGGISAIKVGNLYGRGETGADGFSRFGDSAIQDDDIACEFLSNSVYYLHQRYGPHDFSLSLSANGTNTYGTNLKNPGISPLNSSGFNTNADEYGPDFGAVNTSGSNIFLSEQALDTTNSWFSPLFSREGQRPIEYDSIGKLTSSSDYKTATHNIAYLTLTAASATGAPRYQIISGEHNTHDGIPISLITDPYTAGKGYASLMYNDTVSSTDVLVGQWAGTTGGSSSQAWIPLDLSVPSYTAGSDDLRAKVVVAYADGNDNSAAGSILLRAWHRDTTQSTNFRVYSSSATTVTAGGNPASPTTVTLNLSNVPTSGQDDITTVLLGIRLDFTDNTNIQKYYVVSADIETY